MSALIWQALRLCCQLVLGAIFLVSAAGKFKFPRAFLRSIVDYDLTPLWASIVTAVTLPGIELAVGAVLFFGAAVELARFRASSGEFSVRIGLEPGHRPGWLKRFDVWVDAAAWLAAGMLVFFMILLTIVLLRGMKLDCGCFDFIGEYIPFLRSSTVTWATVWRDAIMLLLALPIIARKS